MHSSHCTTRKERRRSTERADIFQLLDPSYASTSSTTSPNPKVFVDASGTIHDPEFKFFPTDEWKALDEERRRSFEIDEDEQEEEDDYAFGGSKSRSLQYRSYSQRPSSNMSRRSSPSLYTTSPTATPTSPRSFSYNLAVPSTSSFTSSSSPKCSSSPVRKLFRHHHRRPSHEFYDEPEDEKEEFDEEELLDEEIFPRTPELIRDSPLEEDDEVSEQQPSKQSPHTRDLRSKLQVIQLTVQFAMFRANKKLGLRKTSNSF